jgi:hypothetical protein
MTNETKTPSTHQDNEMEDKMTNVNNLPTTNVSGTDGGFFDCDESEDFSPSLIVGSKIKFTNAAQWLVNDEVISPTRKFIVAKIVRAVQKWLPGCRRPESRILQPGERFPNLKKLNAAAPEEEKREAFGQKHGPFENVFVVYLCDPETLEGFSYPTSTVGGFAAVKDLKDCGRRAKLMRGRNMLPLVTLSHTWMNTNYGGRERPHFKICDYIPGGDDDRIAADNKPLLPKSSNEGAKPREAEAKPSEAKASGAMPSSSGPAKNDDLNDEIVF